MYKHQLAVIDVLLGEVQNRSGGGALQGHVSITWWCDDEFQTLWRRIWILSSKVFSGYLCHRAFPHLVNESKPEYGIENK